MKREITPLHGIKAEVTVPGSKSFTQRALVIAALAEGESTLYDPLFAEDTHLLMAALKAVGVTLRCEDNRICISGLKHPPVAPKNPLYLGNNGTGFRLMTAFCALGEGKFILTGDRRLCERPIFPLIYALKKLGVKASCQGEMGTPPVEIKASGITGGQVTLRDVESSQFVSALLMVAPYMPRGLSLTLLGKVPSLPYIEMTCETMKAFGVEVETPAPGTYGVKGGTSYRGCTYQVEGDASSASYFFLAAALTEGKVRIRNLSAKSKQGDLRVLEIMEQMGIQVTRDDSGLEVIGKPLRKGDLTLSLADIPDMVPTLAMLAAVREGKTVITDVAHLRHKESDRLHVLATELNNIGVRVEETADGLIIFGGTARGGEIETYNDHRIAMSFACLGLRIPGIVIRGSECVSKSFPDFWEKFEALRKGSA
ncbi:MAG TPA: 3-phosphoshikimate 1-carboxyvinyltransferase [Syntrophales bacterium]|nr:3-phosphoshikimate 1-carboxyvinyltransferase [Syntrophales bacterium]HOL58821.1 3-phosphoshikimate 1-carboxyvinyltransferase [Syntrophales bacterium]HPO35148.1 3-phosphoshikimate 1-carboxyvinyltransferase [Syntrophales bacterium]